MIVQMPNVDAGQMTELERYIREFATRYEYRLDGSSLWEGRVRTVDLPRGVIQTLVNQHEDGHPMNQYWSRQLSYPVFRVPCGFEPLDAGGWPVVQYHIHEKYRAIIALQDTDVFVVQHPVKVTFRWEVSRIQESADYLLRPRDYLTGYGFTSVIEGRQRRSGAPAA